MIKIGNIIIGKELSDFPFAWVGPVRGKRNEVGTVFISESPSTHKPRINYFTFDKEEGWLPHPHPHIDITKFKDNEEFLKVIDFKVKHDLSNPEKVPLNRLEKTKQEMIEHLVVSSKKLSNKIKKNACKFLKEKIK
jgi:hypothetical protein